MYCVIGWPASPSSTMRPSPQRGSGSRSTIAHLCTRGQASTTRRTCSWKPVNAARSAARSPVADQDSTVNSGSGTLVTK